MTRASSSSSCNSRHNTSLSKRLKTIFKKAYELSILCDIEVCVIYYGPNGELKTWPPEKEKVEDMALRYKAATKRKKNLNLHELKEKQKEKVSEKKKKKGLENVNGIKYPDWYPVFDHYSPDQLFQLIQSLELTLSTLQQRLRFVDEQRQRNTNLVHQSSTPWSLNQHHHQYQTQPMNPSQFSLYNQPPFSASHSNQLTNYHNHLLMQQQLYGFGQNMCMGNITNSKVLEHPYLSNTVQHEFCSDFRKNSYGDMVGNTSFPQDFPDLFSSYGESSLLQTSSQPSLHTIPNSYFVPDNSRFL